jgi:hypothetical protein
MIHFHVVTRHLNAFDQARNIGTSGPYCEMTIRPCDDLCVKSVRMTFDETLQHIYTFSKFFYVGTLTSVPNAFGRRGVRIILETIPGKDMDQMKKDIRAEIEARWAVDQIAQRPESKHSADPYMEFG